MTPCVQPWRRRAWLGAMAAGAAAAWGGPSWARPTPPRLVSVSGAMTEVVFVLGQQDKLVGVDSTSTYPDAAQRLPQVGYMRQLSAEGILSLRPTALLATTEAGPAAVMRQLRDAGLRMHVVPVEYTWQDVRRKIEVVGEATQAQAQARFLWQQIASARDELQRRIAAVSAQSPQAIFVLGHGGSPAVAGRGTAGDAVLRLMGVRNPLHDHYEGYRPLNAEALAGLALDAVVSTRETVQALGGEAQWWERPHWQAVLRRGKRPVLWYEDALGLLGFGPRLPVVLRRGAMALGTWQG